MFVNSYCNVIIYANDTGWSAITEIIALGEAEDNYLICNRFSTSGICVLYHATFNNLYNFQLESLDTFSINFNSHSFLLEIFSCFLKSKQPTIQLQINFTGNFLK